MLWLRTILFTLLVPGTVMGVAPLLFVVSGWGPRFHFEAGGYVGVISIVAGAAIILWCFVDFVRLGHGTPAPYDPPRRLVVAGPYQYVRNPQYVGVVIFAFGEAVISGRSILLGYMALLAVGYHLFVRFYEEPTLRKTFREDYVRYCSIVPR